MLLNFYVNLFKEELTLKFKFTIILFTALFLSSCSTVEIIGEKMNILKPKKTPDVAGKLVCAAAGIESDDCVEAVKTEESNEDKETANPDEQRNTEQLSDQITESGLLLK